MNRGITNSKHLPDLRGLASFVSVAQLGSMTAAAESLGYVPSAISQHVTSLEKTLGGVELFVRTPGRRLVVTAAGRALADAAEELFAAVAAYQDIAQAVSVGEGIELRLGAYGTALSHLLPAALMTLSEHTTTSPFRIVEVETDEGLPMLESGELDVLIAARYLSEDPPRPSEKLKTVSLGQEPLLLTAARWPSGSTPTLTECQERDWVAGAAGDVDRALLHRWSAAVGFEPCVRYETPECHTAIELIASGLAVGLIPASTVNASSSRDRLVVVDLPPEVPVPTRDVLAVTRAGFDVSVVDELLLLLLSSLPGAGEP